jgi:hypothetical protein
MSAASAGRTQVVLVLALACLVVAVWRLAGTARVEAASAGQPVMVIRDERDAGAKEAETAIYVLWPGKKVVEAYNSEMSSFVTYDFSTRKVIYRDADVQITGVAAGQRMADAR